MTKHMEGLVMGVAGRKSSREGKSFKQAELTEEYSKSAEINGSDQGGSDHLNARYS